jgi:hypothetical protein
MKGGNRGQPSVSKTRSCHWPQRVRDQNPGSEVNMMSLYG